MKRPSGRTLADLGETETIARLRRLLPPSSESLLVGPGDDAAVWKPPKGKSLILTTDPLREGVHFSQTGIPWRDIGYKAVMVNASDIVAMGGEPEALLISLGLPGKTLWKDVRELYRGFLNALEVCGADLIGGDLDRTDRVHIEPTMFGSVTPKGVLRIEGAVADEWVYVTGTLGDSRAGLEILLTDGRKKKRPSKDEKTLIGRHYRPPYLFDSMREIRKRFRPTALIDVSDGVARDIVRLSKASGVGAVVQLENLPVSPECFFYCEAVSQDPRLFACRGGEDYQLLFTSKRDPEKAPTEAAGVPVTAIGRTRKSPQRVSFELCGQKVDDLMGYEHFRDADSRA
jgi:thiamine-monophosphate kinase